MLHFALPNFILYDLDFKYDKFSIYLILIIYRIFPIIIPSTIF